MIGAKVDWLIVWSSVSCQPIDWFDSSIDSSMAKLI
jgi:hypothetical protein